MVTLWFVMVIYYNLVGEVLSLIPDGQPLLHTNVFSKLFSFNSINSIKRFLVHKAECRTFMEIVTVRQARVWKTKHRKVFAAQHKVLVLYM